MSMFSRFRKSISRDNRIDEIDTSAFDERLKSSPLNGGWENSGTLKLTWTIPRTSSAPREFVTNHERVRGFEDILGQLKTG